MPTLRSRPPSVESSSSSLAGYIESYGNSVGHYIIYWPLYSLLATATALVLIFYFYRRTRRTNQPLGYTYTYEDVPLKTAVTPSCDISQWYAQLCDPSSLPPLASTNTVPESYIENADFEINPSAFGPIFPGALEKHNQQFEVRCNPTLPAPTIRRHSYPLDDATPEMTKISRNTAEGLGPPRLPRLWVPGRTDTVATVNGCRRHVIVLDGEPFRRESAG